MIDQSFTEKKAVIYQSKNSTNMLLDISPDVPYIKNIHPLRDAAFDAD